MHSLLNHSFSKFLHLSSLSSSCSHSLVPRSQGGSALERNHSIPSRCIRGKNWYAIQCSAMQCRAMQYINMYWMLYNMTQHWKHWQLSSGSSLFESVLPLRHWLLAIYSSWTFSLLPIDSLSLDWSCVHVGEVAVARGGGHSPLGNGPHQLGYVTC